MDGTLLWFGRIWIAAVLIGMTVVDFLIPSRITADWALFHVGWAPIAPVPNPANVLWWVATVALAAPGAGALVLRDQLRRRQRAPSERTTGKAQK
jgi:uncharacterized membrane protein